MGDMPTWLLDQAGVTLTPFWAWTLIVIVVVLLVVGGIGGVLEIVRWRRNQGTGISAEQRNLPGSQRGQTEGDDSPLIQGIAREGSTLKQAGRDFPRNVNQ